MLGIGGDRPIRGEILDATIWYNVQNSLKVSIDVPTGLNAETGNWNGRIQAAARYDDRPSLRSRRSLYE